MPLSLLSDYQKNYGSRLTSLLGGQEENPLAAAALPPPQNAMDQPDPQEQALPQDSQLEQPQGEDPERGGGSQGYTFRDAWKDTPEPAQNQQVDKLEQTLKQGNQTIDQAYDELEKQLGSRPDPKRKLSRNEKGMLLMEFGLSMLANSKKGFAGAAGEAGGQTLQSYQQMKQGPTQQYDADKRAISGARAATKSKFAGSAALENAKSALNPTAAQGGLPGKFTGDDGFVYFYGRDGKAQKALDDKGQPIKAQVNGSAAGGKEFESDAKYGRYMEIYGVDPTTGQPLTGLALQRVKQDALEFANDHGASIDDLDLDILAEKSADTEMGADTYQDLTPEQRAATRNRIADERRRRLRRPGRSRLNPPGGGTGEPGRGGPRKVVAQFTSEADAEAAVKTGKVRSGDLITIGGRRAEVP